MLTTAVVKCSGRVVSVLVEGDCFWVVSPSRGGALSAWGWLRVSGPFGITDPRFTLIRE